MLSGSARIAAIDPQGRNFIDDIGRGDLWNFRARFPHSIQALRTANSSSVRRWKLLGNGDIGYVPGYMGQYIENVGEGPVRMLELFRSDHFADVSLNQWLGLTPAEVVAATLNLDRDTVAAMRKDKPLIMP